MRRLAIHSALFLSFSLLTALGCSQDKGERCQQDTDCASGLVCEGANPGSGYTENGICKASGSTTAKKDAGSVDTRKTDTAPKSDAMTTDVSTGPDLRLIDETRPDTNVMDTPPSPTVDALRADTQTRADAIVDAPFRADAGIDAPIVDAGADALSPNDGALD